MVKAKIIKNLGYKPRNMVKAKIIKNLYATNIIIVSISPYLSVGVNPAPISVFRKSAMSLWRKGKGIPYA
jgi:hypothetical protein